MKKIIGTILIFIYAIIAVFVTVLLLSYNDYKLSEIGGKTLYIVNQNLDETYKKGQLLVIDNVTQNEIEIGDKVFLYKTVTNSDYEVVLDEVIDIDKQGNTIIFYFAGEQQYTISNIIGKESNTTIYNNIGTVLGILESRWGYLFLVVIVTLILFLQELFELVMELKYGQEEAEGSRK